MMSEGCSMGFVGCQLFKTKPEYFDNWPNSVAEGYIRGLVDGHECHALEIAILREALRTACEGWLEGSVPRVKIADMITVDYESWRELAEDLIEEARLETVNEAR